MFVTIDDFAEGKQRFGPCYWTPQGSNLPVRGDKVLVAFDSNQEPWVVMWIPALPKGLFFEGATPPPNPLEGDLWYMHPEADKSWLFRYDPTEDATFPWLFIGGAPQSAFVSGNFSHSTDNTWLYAGNMMTIARAGFYDLEWGCEPFAAPTFPFNWAMQPGTSSSGLGNDYTSDLGGPSTGGAATMITTLYASLAAQLSAGVAIGLWFHVINNSCNFRKRKLAATPIRIA
jgi:hypothetical protein